MQQVLGYGRHGSPSLADRRRDRRRSAGASCGSDHAAGRPRPHRRRPRRSAAPVDPQGSTTGGPGKAAIFAPAGPSLGAGSGHPFGDDPVPALPAEVGDEAARVRDPGPSAQQLAFSEQARDPSWAGTTETEIRRRLGRLDGAQLEAECRHDQCELTIGGSTDSVSSAIAALESTARAARLREVGAAHRAGGARRQAGDPGVRTVRARRHAGAVIDAWARAASRAISAAAAARSAIGLSPASSAGSARGARGSCASSSRPSSG